MKTIQVFDPALCCSTGVCGVEVDQALVSFSADVEWAQRLGAKIERFNLAQQPMAFAENAEVKGALQRSGEAALPLIVRDGQIVLSGRYPTRDELAHWLGSPDAAKAAAVPASAKLAAIAVSAGPASPCCSAPAAASAATAKGASKCC